MSFVWHLENVVNGSVIEMKKNIFLIGRDPKADISTTHRQISRKHATIYILANNELSVTDHKSTNGTFVNGLMITDLVLKEGDVLSFGGTPNDLMTIPEFKDIQFVYIILKKNLVPATESSSRNTNNNQASTSRGVSAVLNGPINDKRNVHNIKISTKKSTETSTIKISENNNIYTEASTSKNCNNEITAKAKDSPTEKSNENKAIKIEQNNSHQFSDSFNDCIVISDDEEESNHPMSQIFKITENIKDEPKEKSSDGFDPYQSIKEELEEINYLEEEQIISRVDLTEEVNGFETVSDLLGVLETQSMIGDDTLLEILEDDVLPGESCNENPIKTPEKGLPILRVNLELSPELENMINLPSKPNAKYVVPPLVEPHNESSRRRKPEPPKRKSVDGKTKEEETDTKRQRLSETKRRKSVDSKRPTLPKPTKNPALVKVQKSESRRNSTDEFKGRPSTEKTARKRRSRSKSIDVTSKFKYNDVKEIRKQKLKELAGVSNAGPIGADQPSTSSKIDRLEGIKKPEKLRFSNVKYSVDLTSSPSVASKKEQSCSSSSTRSEGSTSPDSSTNSATEQSNTEKSNTSSSSSSKQTNYNVKPIGIKNPPPSREDPVFKRPLAPLDPRLKKGNQDKTNKVNTKDRSSNATSRTVKASSSSDSNSSTNLDEVWLQPANFKNAPDSTSAIDKTGVIYQLTAKQNVKKPSNVTPNISVHEEIFHMLCYNAGWILEQKLCVDVSPPVNFGQPVSPMPLNFQNFNHYFDIVMALLRLEHWHYVYEMTMEEGERNKPVVVNLSHERRAGKIAYLDVEYVPESGRSTALPFKVEDFCILEIKTIDASNIYMKSCFGYVQSINTRRQKSGGIITVMIKNFDKKIFRKQFTIKICANIGNCLRLIKTLKHLQSSPLCDYVLKPCTLSNTTPIKCVTVRHTPLLNAIQKQISGEASEMALKNTPGFYLIKGPPGTGKSSVIVSIVLEILFKCRMNNTQPRILLAAPSNAAIDGLIMKLNSVRLELPEPDRKIIKIVRVGPDKSINDLVDNFTLRFQVKKRLLLEKRLNHHPDFKKYSEKKTDLDPFLKTVLGNQYNYEYRVMEDKVLYGANLICTTLNSCTGYYLNQPIRRHNMPFTCCIIDEATQCHEIECLSPIQLGIDKFIIVGDPQQLPAVICHKEAQQLGLDKSLFSRMIENVENMMGGRSSSQTQRFPMKMLCEQYRMHPEICEYPNKKYYEGVLVSRPRISNPIKPALKPYLVFNLKTNDKENERDYVNSREVGLIENLLNTLKNFVSPNCKFSIGIITPYNAQKDIIRQRVKSISVGPNVTVVVNTVDSFQGMENDVIIISCVRYSSNYFLASHQRLNVALTRAKQALYIIGNYKLFTQCATLSDLRSDAKKRKLLLDIRNDIPSFQQFIFSSKVQQNNR